MKIVEFHSLVCDLCGSLFFSKRDLKSHMKRVHSDGTNVKHPCDECGKEFGSKSDMLRHVRVVHWKIKGLSTSGKCDECGKEFAFKGDATRHMRTVHNLFKDPDFELKVCPGKCFKIMSRSQGRSS